MGSFVVCLLARAWSQTRSKLFCFFKSVARNSHRCSFVVCLPARAWSQTRSKPFCFIIKLAARICGCIFFSTSLQNGMIRTFYSSRVIGSDLLFYFRIYNKVTGLAETSASPFAFLELAPDACVGISAAWMLPENRGLFSASCVAFALTIV